MIMQCINPHFTYLHRPEEGKIIHWFPSFLIFLDVIDISGCDTLQIYIGFVYVGCLIMAFLVE